MQQCTTMRCKVIRKRMKLAFIAAAILCVGCVWWGSNVSYAEQLSLHEWGQIVGPDPLACDRMMTG